MFYYKRKSKIVRLNPNFESIYFKIVLVNVNNVDLAKKLILKAV